VGLGDAIGQFAPIARSPKASQQFQIQKPSIDYVPIPPAAQARASKGTRLNPAGSFSAVLSTLEGGFLTSPPLTRGWVKSGVSQFPNLELLKASREVYWIVNAGDDR
jgi:hypothetical protein